MKVRIKQERSNSWLIQVWRWWWPFWRTVDHATVLDTAKQRAGYIKNPTILEVQ